MGDYTAEFLADRFYIAFTKGGRAGVYNSEPITLDDALDDARKALESGGEVCCIEPAVNAFIATPHERSE